MYVRDLLLSLLRRWYVLVAGLVATAALCAAAFVTIPQNFDAKGSVLLLPPKSSVGSRGNPYLYLGGLAQAVEVLSARLNASQVRKPIQEAHPDATFDVGQDATTTGPIVAVTVSTSTSAEDALAVVRAVMEQLPGSLTSMQDELSIPEGSRISSLVLIDPAEAEVTSRARNRGVIAIGGVGLAGTVLLAGLIDGILVSRSRRRAESRGELSETTDDADSGAEAKTDAGHATKSSAGNTATDGTNDAATAPSVTWAP